MIRRHSHTLFLISCAALACSALPSACSSSSSSSEHSAPNTGGSSEGGEGGAPGGSGSAPDGGSTAQTGGAPSAGGQGPTGGQAQTGGLGGEGGEPPNDSCGAVELCDSAHVGLDDDCNGQVDEGCPCAPGLAQACFKGDADKVDEEGCFKGTQECTEQGAWGPCLGGVHDVGDDCSGGMPVGCHAITALPFGTVSLEDGLGSFGADAQPGTEVFSVTCPSGVTQCPTPASGDFKPVQSGEYTVTYQKTVAGEPTPQTCTYPLVVRGRGLRVELSWEHTTADSGVDVDLHLHQPGNTGPWSFNPAFASDCSWANCTVQDFTSPSATAPTWFANSATPPDPVNWHLDPTFENNTCYNSPKGAQWQSIGMGCHNPRLDVDNIQCDASITDPTDDNFCFPENINVDFPPDDQWMRVAVHYYSNRGRTYDIHPQVKIYCGGALAAHVGPRGYYTPEAPLTFAAASATSPNSSPFWMVADVAFGSGGSDCTVRPIYADAQQRTPYLTTKDAATAFAPPYSPLP